MLGDFYPLFPHDASEETWYGYQFHRPDLDAGMALVFRREKSADATQTIRLRALDPKRTYEVGCEDTGEKRTATGAELSSLTVEIPTAPGSAMLFYRASK
jgi:hypothetical protein